MASVPFMPNYTARNENKRTREVITNTEWNELWNLNSAQGDHSEKYLDDLSKFLFTSAGFDNTRTNVIAIIEGKADTHIARKDNPHEVKANQVPNTAITDLTATNVQSSLAEINSTLWAHKRMTNNPHSVTKAQVGLGNCDNTSDANKPISDATQAEFDRVWDETERIDDAKVEKSSVVTVLGGDHTTIPTSKAVSDAMMEAGALPSGGLRGQALTKRSDTNYDAEWHTVMPLGGNQGDALVKHSGSDLDTEWAPPVPRGGFRGQVLSKSSDSDLDLKWDFIDDSVLTFDFDDIDIATDKVHVNTDWTTIKFSKVFVKPPKVFTELPNENYDFNNPKNEIIQIKDITTSGFKARVLKTEFDMSAATKITSDNVSTYFNVSSDNNGWSFDTFGMMRTGYYRYSKDYGEYLQAKEDCYVEFTVHMNDILWDDQNYVSSSYCAYMSAAILQSDKSTTKTTLYSTIRGMNTFTISCSLLKNEYLYFTSHYGDEFSSVHGGYSHGGSFISNIKYATSEAALAGKFKHTTIETDINYTAILYSGVNINK